MFHYRLAPALFNDWTHFRINANKHFILYPPVETQNDLFCSFNFLPGFVKFKKKLINYAHKFLCHET